MSRPRKQMRARLLEWFGDLPPESRPRVIEDLKLIDFALLRRERQEAENGDTTSPTGAPTNGESNTGRTDHAVSPTAGRMLPSRFKRRPPMETSQTAPVPSQEYEEKREARIAELATLRERGRCAKMARELGFDSLAARIAVGEKPLTEPTP